jgi:NAD-dependent DNA ligase
MYALAIELDGDVDKRISSQSKPLSGLTFALAGHFSGGREGSDGIRSKITRLGGVWADNVSRSCSALITGTSPSVSKLDKAAYFDMEVIPVEVIDDLFAVEPNAGDKVVASNPPTAETRRIANPDNKKFADKTFVFTGELEQITRIEAMDMVERCGGKVSGSVSGKTNYVVAGSAPGSKIERAHELGIAVISEQEFLEMLPHT